MDSAGVSVSVQEGMQAAMSSGVAMLHFRHQESLLPKHRRDLYLCCDVQGWAPAGRWARRLPSLGIRSAPAGAQALVLSKHRAHGRLSALEKADDCD